MALYILWVASQFAIPAGQPHKKKEYFFTANHATTKNLLRERQAVLRYAQTHSLRLRGLRLRVKRARAGRRGTSAFPNNPVLSGGGGAQLPVTGVPSTGGVLPRARVGLSWAVPIGGRWGRLQKLAQMRFAMREKEVQRQQFLFSLQVHAQLNAVAGSWQMWQTQRRIARFVERLELMTKQRIQHGSARALDLQFAQSARLQAQQAVLSASLRHQLTRQTLKKRIGWQGEGKMPWKMQSIPALPPVPSRKKLLAYALQHQLRLVIARRLLQQAKAAVALARARGIPDLTLSLGYALEDNNHVVVGGASIPLPLFWRNQRGVGQARVSVLQAKVRLARTKRLVRRDLESAWLRYRMHRRMVALFARRFASIQKRSRLFVKGFRQGTFSVFRVLTVQRTILRGQLQTLRGLLRAHRSYLQLCQMAGQAPVYGRTNAKGGH